MTAEVRPAVTPAMEIPSRFCGPAGRGNGGYVCGRVAAYVDGPATVTLHRPPPLDTALDVDRDDAGSVRVHDRGVLIAGAQPAPDAPRLEIPAAVTPAQVRAAAGRARYFQDPIFPDCFVCGPARESGDGLRIFPGQLTGREVWAAPWTPDSSVAEPDGRVRAEIVWAVLDCPSGIAAAETAALDAAIVLGRLNGPAGGAARSQPAVRRGRLARRAGRAEAHRLLGAARFRRRGTGRGPRGLAHCAVAALGGDVVTAGRRAVGLTPMETRRDIIVAAAVLADELGYETFAVPEGWGLDSTPVLAEIALRTSRIKLASAVLSVWGRTPATLAMTAATLHQMSAGRYVLGLGASTPALAEGFHDVPFAHPASRLREVVTAVRALLAGEPAPLRRVPAAYPLRLGQPPVPELPIWVAALGPRATHVAAELGDGWIPALVARDHLPAWAARLREVRAAAVPGSGAFTVAAGPIAAAADDADAARQIAASCVAWYLTAMGGVYAGSVAAQGYPDEVAAVIAANPRPSPRRGVIPPEARAMLAQLAVCGSGAEVREQAERWDEVADVATILLPPGMAWSGIQATLRAAAPARSTVAARP